MNQFTVSTIGDGAGPTFFERRTDNKIYVKSGVDLPKDTQRTYTVRFISTDFLIRLSS
jgi:hypothetical protein